MTVATDYWSRDDLRTILPGLAALGIAIALALDQMTLRVIGYDLAAYILGARRLITGEPLYPGDQIVLGPFGQFVYPPPVAAAFVPFAALPFDVARAILLAALVGLAGGVTWILVRPLRLAVRYWAAAATVAFFPLIYEVTLENLTLVTLAMCLMAWHLRARPGRAGAAFAFAVGVKLLPLSLIAFLLSAGRSRVLAWSAVVLVILAAGSWPFVGAHWPAYLALLGRLAAAPSGASSNIVPAPFSTTSLRIALPTLALAVAILVGGIARARDGREDHAFRVALAAAPLVATTVWYPYLVFALPLLMASAPRAADIGRIPLAWARPVSWLLIELQRNGSGDPEGRELILPLIGLLLLLAVGLIELWIPSVPAPASRSIAPRPHRSGP